MGLPVVNRWHHRLAELHGHGAEQPAALPLSVQNVQNVQNPAPTPPFEHSEQIAQRTQEAPTAREPVETPGWSETEDERAAIVEHDGKIPRAWAEGFARIDPDRPPSDVPAKRWLRFVDDVGLFLDGPFCAIAAALGWGPLDLFGCDRDRPFARIDQAGLLWLLNGEKLIALSENTAAIETKTNSRQTYRRKPSEPDRVLAWELAP